ncbi:hypothetical protein PVK06_047420 [Gossypium arboreum]|uniref:Reverse transcriptase n=1 Tax=Gossypium arboreum TaxID=29729 RepID=A0ABR0MDQ6_GOSAR|nr:hypothetical protein PVK06_047420 [Gossypium arboreum]
MGNIRASSDPQEGFNKVMFYYRISLYSEWKDNLVLLCNKNVQKANMVNNILQKFGRCFGHKANKSKSQVFFSKAVGNDLANQITCTFGMEHVADLGRYLGVLMLHKRVTNATNSFIIEKVRKRLSGWNAKLLSLVGWVSLAKSVLFTIPSYFMQSTLTPKGVCQDIEKIIRRFPRVL